MTGPSNKGAVDIGKSLRAVSQSLIGVSHSLWGFLPSAVIAFLVLFTFVGFLIAQSESAMEAAALIVVFSVSVAVYFREKSYGQAMLAFVVGLLPALSLLWSPGRFWAFVGGFFGLSCLFLITSAIRSAARVEPIYKQAAVYAMREESAMTDKKLEALAKKAGTEYLGPNDRAECVRELMFRNLPLGHLPGALKSVEKMSMLTGLPVKEVASYLVSLYPLVDATGLSFSRLDDRFYLTLRDSAATPEEFFEAFRKTRNLVLEGRMDLETYLRDLSDLLSFGLPPEEIRRRMEATHEG